MDNFESPVKEFIYYIQEGYLDSREHKELKELLLTDKYPKLENFKNRMRDIVRNKQKRE